MQHVAFAYVAFAKWGRPEGAALTTGDTSVVLENLKKAITKLKSATVEYQDAPAGGDLPIPENVDARTTGQKLSITIFHASCECRPCCIRA